MQYASSDQNTAAGNEVSTHRLWGDWASVSRRSRLADQFAILMAISLPWSTTILGIFTALWLITLATVIDMFQFRKQLSRPACWLPVALFCLAVAGMAWADAPLGARTYAGGTMAKLLAIPLLIYQFERSENGIRVFLAFLASCTALLALSWLNWLDPRTVLPSDRPVGVPVKNWITQGVEFVLCIFGAAALAVVMWRKQRPYAATGLALLCAAFFLNMAFVASSRTSLVSLPVLLLISTLRYIGWRRAIALNLTIVIAAVLTWFLAPNLRERIDSIQQEYSLRDSRITSLFNAHLSDYVEGWIYVMGVGVAGGMISKLPKSSAIPDDALTGSDPGVPAGR